MKLFKKITNPEKVRSFLSAFIIFFLMNNVIAIKSENNLDIPNSKNSHTEFEETFFKNSIPYNVYDNSESQLKIFFGRYSDRHEKSFYPELSIINASDSLRELYKSKLNDMAINQINYNINK
tara:strand:+ start:210 stop:575 length:366 start_codon:yes stop_codon:yes gene_type:complete